MDSPIEIAIKALPNCPGVPRAATSASAGLDLRAAVSAPLELAPGARVLVGCGIAIALPPGSEAQVRPRSGLALKHGVTVLNSPGTIDADYRGELGVILINHGQESFTIEPGMRIAQLVVARLAPFKIIECSELPDTDRGAGGFGHSGTH